MPTLAEVISAGVDDDGALCALALVIPSSTKRLHTPMTLWGPISLMNLSLTEPLALP